MYDTPFNPLCSLKNNFLLEHNFVISRKMIISVFSQRRNLPWQFICWCVRHKTAGMSGKMECFGGTYQHQPTTIPNFIFSSLDDATMMMILKAHAKIVASRTIRKEKKKTTTKQETRKFFVIIISFSSSHLVYGKQNTYSRCYNCSEIHVRHKKIVNNLLSVFLFLFARIFVSMK